MVINSWFSLLASVYPLSCSSPKILNGRFVYVSPSHSCTTLWGSAVICVFVRRLSLFLSLTELWHSLHQRSALLAKLARAGGRRPTALLHDEAGSFLLTVTLPGCYGGPQSYAPLCRGLQATAGTGVVRICVCRPWRVIQLRTGALAGRAIERGCKDSTGAIARLKGKQSDAEWCRSFVWGVHIKLLTFKSPRIATHLWPVVVMLQKVDCIFWIELSYPEREGIHNISLMYTNTVEYIVLERTPCQIVFQESAMPKTHQLNLFPKYKFVSTSLTPSCGMFCNGM